MSEVAALAQVPTNLMILSEDKSWQVPVGHIAKEPMKANLSTIEKEDSLNLNDETDSTAANFAWILH